MAAPESKIGKLVDSLAGAKSSQARQEIIDELVEIGSPAVPQLVELLNNGEYKVRMAAATTLGEIGDDQAIEPLIESLSDTSKNVQRVTTVALIKIGEGTVSALLDALIGKDQLARKWAAEALGSIGDASVAQQLIARLNDPNIEVQRAVVTALGDLKSKRAIEPLIKVLESDNIELARAATEALGQIRSNVAIDPLVAALSSFSEDVRSAAAQALAHIGSDAVPPLLDELGTADRDLRLYIVEVLGNIGDDRARRALTKALQNPDERVVAAAAIALGKLGKRLSVKDLAKLIDSNYASVRCAAAQGLGSIGIANAVKPLSHLLEDNDWVTRMAAAGALGEVGSRKGVQPLIQALHDPEWSVRLHSAKALGQTGQKKYATQALIDSLDDPHELVQREVGVALAKLGAIEATEILEEFAGARQSDEATEEVAKALQMLEEDS